MLSAQDASAKARMAVLVSGGGTNLQAIIDACGNGLIPDGEVVLVISSCEGAYALERAKQAGIQGCVLNKKALGGQEAWDAAALEKLEEARVDLIVLAGFLSQISPALIQRFPQRIINIHPSLIPSFCGKGMYGLHVHEAALAKGVKVSGATVHFVNEITDGGQIIAQKAVEVAPDDTPETLQRRIMEQAEWVLLPQVCAQLCKEIIEQKR